MRVSEFYRPFERQTEFHKSGAKYRLFGGAAGPGKTRALLWEAVTQANAWPNVDTLLLRRTHPELEESLIREFLRSVPRDLYRNYNATKCIVEWHNGSRTRFSYCRSEKDVYQYQGAEYLFIGIDELTHFTLSQWQYLTSRNRCPVPGSFPCMAGATNPGNVGHAWVKALWIDKKSPAGYERPDMYNPEEYDFIRAKLSDNPIYANDAGYRKTLESLPDNLRRALLNGDWDVFAGQYFDIFAIDRHVAERVGSVLQTSSESYEFHDAGSGRVVQTPKDVYDIQDWWTKWISIDWGFEHPSAVYWHTIRPDRKVITYRELVQNHLTGRMLGEGIAERNGTDRIQAVYVSPDAFGHKTSESSIAEDLGAVLSAHGIPRPQPAQDDRVIGWQFLYGLLQRDAAAISEDCPKLIECIPSLVHDELGKIEDVKKMDGDDPADSWRYGLVTHLQPGRVPVEVAVAERLEKAHITDPTSLAIFSQKFEAEERRRFQSVVKPRRFRGSRI